MPPIPEDGVTVGLMLAAALLLPGMLISGLESFGLGQYGLLLVVPAVFVALPLVRMKRLGVGYRALGLRWLSWHVAAIAGILVGSLALLSNALLTTVSTEIAGWWIGAEAARDIVHTEQARFAAYFAPETSPLAVAYLILLLVVITPIAEELFFRGYVYASLRNRWGVRPALFASAVIFSVFHFYIIQFLPIFVAGLIFAWLYERTASMIAPVVAHAVVNGFVVFMLLLQRT